MADSRSGKTEETLPPLLTRPFALLTVGHFLQALGYATAVLLPLYLDHLNASRTEVGLIMASAGVGGLLFRPLVGWALDTIGRKVCLVAGTIILGASLVGIALVDVVGPLVYVLRFIYGIGVGALFTAYFTFASDIIPASRRTEGIALFGVSGLVPLAINPFIMDSGIATADLRWLFPIVGGVILSSLIAVFMLDEPEQEIHAEPLAPGSALKALRRRELWPVWVATVVFACLVATFMTYATLVADNRGVELSAGIWLTYAGGAVCVRLFGARLPDRIGPSRLVAPAVGVYVLAAFVTAIVDTSTGFMLAGLLAGIGHGYCFPVLTAQVINRMPQRLRGSGMATFTALWEVSALALTPVFGVIADVSNDANLFYSLAAFSLVGLCGWYLLEKGVAEPVLD